MKSTGRSITATAVGLILGIGLIYLLERVANIIVPLPEMNLDNTEVLNHPTTESMLMILFAWFTGTFAGALISAAISESYQMGHALLVGTLLLAIALIDLVLIPHPSWFWAAGLAVFLPASFLGGKLGLKIQSSEK